MYSSSERPGGPQAPAAVSEVSGDAFSRATRRLVVLFGAIVVTLVLASAIIVYGTITADLHTVLDRTVVNENLERDLYAQALVRLRYQVLAIDGAIFLVIGATGLWYARRTMKPIRDALDNQRRFIADASHELRTPLAIMKADFELARTGEQSVEELREALDEGADEVERMSAIVADLLMLSRIDAREERLQIRPTDLEALLAETAAKLCGLAAVHDVRIVFRGIGEPLTAMVDPDRLQRALLNLCRNGIEHSPPGAQVTLTVTVTPQQLRIDVVDDGHGMTREQLAHAFERFYRAEHTSSPVGGNSGLGLPIAKWIVSAHGGSLTLSSGPGRGTTATVRLPLRGERRA